MSFWDYIPHTWEGLAVQPLTPLYAIGAGINELTGGESRTWSPTYAVQNPEPAVPRFFTQTEDGRVPFVADIPGQTRLSPFIQAASGYNVPGPGAQPVYGGDWRLPVFNPAGAEVAGDIIKDVTDNLFGLTPKAILLGAAALAAVALGRE